MSFLLSEIRNILQGDCKEKKSSFCFIFIAKHEMPLQWFGSTVYLHINMFKDTRNDEEEEFGHAAAVVVCYTERFGCR
jgi:hypothetical protein